MAGAVGSEQTGSITSTSRVDEAADELYALPPSEFTAARTRLVAAARDKAEAKAIGALRRPTQAAWAVNRLVRSGASVLVEALELGERLRDAQRQLHGSELRRLDRRRRELVTELTALAADEAGLTGEALTQVRNTFTAAMSDAELAEQVRGGRLTKALEYSGFGPLSDGSPVPDDLSARREQRRGRRLAEAREAVEEAEERVDGFRAEVKTAGAEHAQRVRELDDVRAELRAAERAAQQAGRKWEKAKQRLESAEAARAAAEAAVEELRG
jgi:chromosome segregation ATPase